MERDIGTACSDFILCITSFFCTNLVYKYSSSPSSAQQLVYSIEFEPAIKSLFYVQYASLIGAIRFGIIPRGQLIVLGHNLMTVLGQQLSISLLGLSYFLLTFRSSRICQYFISNFNEIFTSLERTLLIIIIIAHLLNIQHIGKVIPLLFGITPIIITIIITQNFNIFLCGIMSLSTLCCAIMVYQQKN